ncbi:MAG: hypothetical protein H0V54_09430 [Chthoniobacterales bacterium]|nr:hypothetical protein [Chthoniobacterales bacterium]
MDKFAKVAECLAKLTALLLTVVYLVTGVTFLCLDYWPVTGSDFWRIYYTCLTSSWIESALLKFNNHSLFFPSFIWLSDLHFFHGNQTILFGVGLALQAASTFLLLLPIWRDPGLDVTGKYLGTLTIICGSFWMGRATITTSGGFNCITSLVMLSAAAGFLILPRMRTVSTPTWRTTTLLICAGFVATFSFGSGMAVWPTFLLLGWNLRVPRRSLAIIAFATLVALLIFSLLPPPEDSSALWESLSSLGLIFAALLKQLCSLIGAPIFYSISAWHGAKPTAALIQTSGWLLWGGAAGLALSAIVVTARLTRRDLDGRNMEFVGLALITFNLFVLLSVVASRAQLFLEIPVDVAAPRYLFWSSFFWAGLLLVALHHALLRRWLRWPCILLALTFPIVGWQFHRNEGSHWRFARVLLEQGATSLINDVVDPARQIIPDQEQIDFLVPLLRARRLDMFAAGLQDWIGQPATQLFQGRQDERDFRGRASLQRLIGGKDQGTAIKVTGHLAVAELAPPSAMIIVDPAEKVVGIARSSNTWPLWNSLFYANRMPNGQILGYIRNHQPGAQYFLRAASPDGVSRQKIRIAPSPR